MKRRMKARRLRIKVEILRMKVMLILVLMNVQISKGERWTMNLSYGAVKRVSCFSHTLQLVVHTFQQCKSFKNLLKSAHSVVKKVNKSTKATERLIALSGKKLVGDCPTRWSSTYLLVLQMLQVRTLLLVSRHLRG